METPSELSLVLDDLISSPRELTAEEAEILRRAARDYPASGVAPALLLRFADGRLSDSERTALRARVALGGGDPTSIIATIDPAGNDFGAFYPPEPAQRRPSTENAITTFLETYGHTSPEEDALLERMIFNPVPDYAEQLARTEPAPLPSDPSDRQSTLIDAFLASQPAPAPDDQPVVPVEQQPLQQPQPDKKKKTRPQTPPPPPERLLSESLAKIFIKQGRYERAYEIITNLSLNYPEKSVYFADQLRFLRKLIINSRHAPVK